MYEKGKCKYGDRCIFQHVKKEVAHVTMGGAGKPKTFGGAPDWKCSVCQTNVWGRKEKCWKTDCSGVRPPTSK